MNERLHLIAQHRRSSHSTTAQYDTVRHYQTFERLHQEPHQLPINSIQFIQFKSPASSPLYEQILSQTQPWQISEAMAPSKNNSHSSSSNRHGEHVGRPNILASAYCVDSSARLTGFHYSTTGAGGTYSCPPLHSIEL
jgi:hypothetical protein